MFFNIVILTYNSSQFLNQCLNSLFVQKFKFFEIIIIDKFSKDKTDEIINIFKKKSLKIKLFKKNLGLYESLNFAYQKLNSSYTITLHSDDYFQNSSALSTIYTFIQNNKKPDVIYSNLNIIKKNKIFRKWKSGTFNKKKIKLGWMPPHPTIIIKTSIIKKLNLYYDTKFKISSDYEFFLRLFYLHNLSFHYLDYCYYVMRSGGLSSKNFESQLIKIKEDRLISNLYKLPIYTFLMKRLIKIIQFLL